MYKFMALLFIVLGLFGCQPIMDKGNAAHQYNGLEFSMLYIQRGDYERAEKLLRQLLSVSASAQAWDVYAYLKEKEHDALSAERDYLYAITLSPESGAVYNNYGVFLCGQHRRSEAEMQFKNALSMSGYAGAAKAEQNLKVCVGRRV